MAVMLVTLLGCRTDPGPSSDLVGSLEGVYEMKEMTTISAFDLNGSFINTSKPPYTVGRIRLERAKADPGKIGLGAGFISSGNPISEQVATELLQVTKLPDPQKMLHSVWQKNDTIYFTNDSTHFGKYCRGTLIHKIVTPSDQSKFAILERTVIATRIN